MELVDKHGGTHHGYFLPSEGASDIAYALFSFPSLAEYERYRARFGVDEEFIAADRIRDETGCVKRFERTFLRPLLPGAPVVRAAVAPRASPSTCRTTTASQSGLLRRVLRSKRGRAGNAAATLWSRGRSPGTTSSSPVRLTPAPDQDGWATTGGDWATGLSAGALSPDFAKRR